MMTILNVLPKILLPRLLLLAAIGALVGCALLEPEPVAEASDKPIGLAMVYPPGSIATVDMADLALRDATTRRKIIQDAYLQEEVACFDRFFMTACTDKAAERRRIALAEVRSVEVQANFVKRRDRAESRDRALAERVVQDTAEAPQRLDETMRREQAAADKAARRDADAGKAAATEQRVGNIDPLQRQHEHEANLARQQAKQASQDTLRAANVKAFEKKKADAIARQKQVAEAKANKQAERERKEAAAKEAADQAAADAAAAAAKK
jgi:hypothetical protein